MLCSNIPFLLPCVNPSTELHFNPFLNGEKNGAKTFSETSLHRLVNFDISTFCFHNNLGTKADERLNNLNAMMDKLEGIQEDIREGSASIDRLKDAVADRGTPAGDVRAIKEQQLGFQTAPQTADRTRSKTGEACKPKQSNYPIHHLSSNS